MKTKHLLFTLFFLTMPFLASAYSFEVDGIYYNINSDKTTITVTSGINKYEDDVIIPDTVIYNGSTYLVTSIGDYAFEGCVGLTSVTIPESVMEIGDYAFMNCTGITSITIPISVTSIGNSAFYGCIGLTSITIPNSVISIGLAFGGCTNLTDIIVDGNNPNYASVDGVLYNKNITSILRCPEGKTTITIPESVMEIGDYAFMNCTGITSITIPISVTSIGEGAFYICPGLTSITIPNSVASIGITAFGGCTGLTSITIPESVTSIGAWAFDGCTGLTFVTIPNSITNIELGVFVGCTGLTSITIPESVTSIGNRAFNGCTGLTTITIPNSVMSIGNDAFAYCTGLTSIAIPENVTSIGRYAFYKCTGLTAITIGNRITSIGDYAFYDCLAIREIYCLATIPPVCGNDVFNAETYGGATLYIPVGCKADYEVAEPWMNFTNIEESEYTGIENVEMQDITISRTGNNIVVNGIEGVMIEIYDMQGVLVYRGTDTTISLPTHGVYIVRVGNKIQKVVL